MKNFLSFYGGFVSRQTVLTSIKFLPSDSSTGILYSEGDFNLYISPSKSPLYDDYILREKDILLFVNGFFYENLSKQRLKQIINSASVDDIIAILLKELSGSFNGVIVNLDKKEMHIFSDHFGFDKVYYKIRPAVVSSFIWTQVSSENIDNESLAEHLLFGHPLGGSTVYENIKVHQPGFITSIGVNSHKKRIYTYKSDKILKLDIDDVADIFLDLVKQQVKYINSKFNSENTFITLTGGGDTRVILNSLLRLRIKPDCITGSYPQNDVPRSSELAKLYGLKHMVIDYNNYLENYYRNIMDVIVVSNGYTNGWWMNLISQNSLSTGQYLMYGFSGDILAGSDLYGRQGNIKIKDIRKRAKYKSQFQILEANEISVLSGVPESELIDRYYDTFKGVDGNESQIYEQERNEFNFRRIGSFADGARCGSMPIYFFHDRRIVEFYHNLNEKYRKNERLHRYLGYVGNALSKEISISAKSNTSSSFELLMMNTFGKNILINIIAARNKLRNRALRTKKRLELSREYLFSDLPEIEDDPKLFDYAGFNSSTRKKNIPGKDYDTLKMRIWDICLSNEYKKNMRRYDHKIDMKNGNIS